MPRTDAQHRGGPIAALALAILAALLWPAHAPAQGRPAGVTTDVVTEAEMSETVAVFGEVVSGRQSRVAARVAGVAETVPLRVGDRVAEGDVLLEIDTELFEIGLAEARAQVTVAEAGIEAVTARLDRAEKAFRRAEQLVANSTIAEAQLEDRASEYAEALGLQQEARARVEAARTALRRARYDLENATILAPFDGVVVEVSTEIGQFVAAGSQVATLIDTDAMEVEASVPARYVSALRPDLPVAGRTDAGGALDLQLRAILPTEFASTRTRPVRFEIRSSEAAPAAGQSVTLNVPVSAPRTVAAVPKDALIQGRGGWQVFLAVEGQAQPRNVEIGAALGDRFEVVSGLAPGDVVVVRGNERLRPGQDIAPRPIGAAPAGPGGAGGGRPPGGAPEASEGGGGESGSGAAPADAEDERRQAAVDQTD